jgi:glutamate/tyrosine decarboxylase-like PLP-dependent enzyme
MKTPDYQFWKQLDQSAIKKRVFDALEENISYADTGSLGIPASTLDAKVFSQDESFIKDAPFISTLVQNPNHIGCHTIGKSESYFAGTQAIERELIEICAVDILGGEPGMQDGYVASGGTEANMQAIWIYRNYYLQSEGVSRNQIAIVCSEDRHYSMDKAADILALSLYTADVEMDNRKMSEMALRKCINRAVSEGKTHFIMVCNMMCTMFGSVDDVEACVRVFREKKLAFKLHVDGAFGGFFYPFTDNSSAMSFRHQDISSFTLDAHKMAQAPYGTGIFLIRKGMMKYATTQAASYVEGEDSTIIGSRSGANAIAVWMVLSKHGPYGWHEKILVLQKRTDWIEEQLKGLHIAYFRQAGSNIIAIKAEHLSNTVAKEFGLVPDDHHTPRWYKIVVMEHVTIERVLPLIERLSSMMLDHL